MKWLEALTPEYIKKLTPYASARRSFIEGDVWLNANENPSVPGLEDQLWKLNRYPDFQPRNLLKCYAEYVGVQESQLLVTRGIDEGIDLLIGTFCETGVDRIVYTPPTYGMYKIAAESKGVEACAVPLSGDFQLDIDLIKKTISEQKSNAYTGSLSNKTQDVERVETTDTNQETGTSASSVASLAPKLIFLCSPNNPTGGLLKRADVIAILEAARDKSLVILDEAYIEFIPEASVVGLLDEYPNLVVLRTLSKAFGLAGLRCGFVMAQPDIIQLLRKVIAPYPIPAPVVELVTQALSGRGIAKMKEAVSKIVTTRKATELQLDEFSFIQQVYSGNANFILFKVTDAGALISFLTQLGIIIRDQSFQAGLENCVRVTIGSPSEMNGLYQALQEFEENL